MTIRLYIERWCPGVNLNIVATLSSQIAGRSVKLGGRPVVVALIPTLQ